MFSLDTIYDAAAKSRISHDSWNILEPLLPNSSYWFYWDKCKRIVEGVAEAFISKSLSPDLFAHITANESIFRELAIAAKERSGGRSFLKAVLNKLRSEAQPSQIRISTINRLL